MSRVYEMQNTPPVADYVRALTALSDRVTDEHRTLFRVHYQAPDRTATAKQLATWANLAGGWTIVNSRYGKLGHAICNHLGIRPRLIPDDAHRWWSVWSRGWSTPGGFVWQMLPAVAEALEHLGWVGSVLDEHPDQAYEGARSPSAGGPLLIGPHEQGLFAIENTRERADRLQEQLVPKLRLLLDRACGLLRDVYGTDVLSPYRMPTTPAHRPKSKKTQPFELATAGLAINGQAWFFQQRLECTSNQLRVALFGLRGLEGNPIVRILKDHTEEVVRLLGHDEYEIESSAVDPSGEDEGSDLAEFIKELRLVSPREWEGTSIKGPPIYLPIEDIDEAASVLYDFVALFPIFRAATHVLAGEDDRFAHYAERFWNRHGQLQEMRGDADSSEIDHSTSPGPASFDRGEANQEAVEFALEGGFKMAIRRHRLREKRLRKRKIAEALRAGAGRLRCEVPGCGFDFLEVYGELGRDFAHVHHTNPLSDRTEPEMTKLRDLAIVCANCHAMIHRGRQCRPLEGLISQPVPISGSSETIGSQSASA